MQVGVEPAQPELLAQAAHPILVDSGPGRVGQPVEHEIVPVERIQQAFEFLAAQARRIVQGHEFAFAGGAGQLGLPPAGVGRGVARIERPTVVVRRPAHHLLCFTRSAGVHWGPCLRWPSNPWLERRSGIVVRASKPCDYPRCGGLLGMRKTLRVILYRIDFLIFFRRFRTLRCSITAARSSPFAGPYIPIEIRPIYGAIPSVW